MRRALESGKIGEQSVSSVGERILSWALELAGAVTAEAWEIARASLVLRELGWCLSGGKRRIVIVVEE